MPKSSLVDEIMETAAVRSKGGPKCRTCFLLSETQRKAIVEAHARGASIQAIADHVITRWGLSDVTFHSVRAHLANKHA